MPEAQRAELPDDKAQRYAGARRDRRSDRQVSRTEPPAMATVASHAGARVSGPFFWTGFYVVDRGETERAGRGSYQGTLGCLRIPFGQGRLRRGGGASAKP